MEKIGVDLIDRYFELDDTKRFQFEKLEALYLYWNERINVISRKDIERLYERHVLHSLAIARVVEFVPDTRVLDIGTGGGFPGIPLAILFPEAAFFLSDGKAKKIKVVNAVADELGLKNVTARHVRAEQAPGKYDFAVSRAVTDLGSQWDWIERKLKPKNRNKLPNGFIALKGGDLTEEIDESGLPARVYSLSDFFKEEFFETKKAVYVPR